MIYKVRSKKEKPGTLKGRLWMVFGALLVLCITSLSCHITQVKSMKESGARIADYDRQIQTLTIQKEKTQALLEEARSRKNIDLALRERGIQLVTPKPKNIVTLRKPQGVDLGDSGRSMAASKKRPGAPSASLEK